MRYHKQLFRHRPAEGIYGDCFRTAIACLLDLEPEDVPHYHEGICPDGADQLGCMNEWLAERGLLLHSVPFEGDRAVILKAVSTYRQGCRFLLGGQSVPGIGHVVICRNGEIEHDTHPDDPGLCQPDDDGFWWIYFVGKIV